MKKIIVAPSLLSADFTRLEDEIKRVQRAGADILHIDIMDGHFVPNITIGPGIVKFINSVTKLPLDVHLMIEKPENFIERFKMAGADILTVHIEACPKINTILSKIKHLGIKAAVSVKPKTPISAIKKVLDKVDMVLIMTVEPGFGGQAFIREVVPKIGQLRKIYKKDIEVDGGINDKNARIVVAAGANVLVAGTYIFGAKDAKAAIKKLRCPT